MLPFPKQIMIEATNCCNNRCFFCGSMFCERERGYMDAQLMKRLIEEGYRAGATSISFHGTGEPFLCQNLEDYIKMAKDVGYSYVYLDSNGILATPDRIKGVVDAGLDSIKFSLHAITAQTYKEITGNDKYDVIMDNIQYMRSYVDNSPRKCKIIAHFVLNKVNENELDGFKELMQQYADEVWIVPVVNDGGISEIEDYSTDGDLTTMKNGFCSELSGRITVNWDGTVSACCMDWTDQLVYGDAKKHSLIELWNCDKINELRDKHLKQENMPEVCLNCLGLKKEEN